MSADFLDEMGEASRERLRAALSREPLAALRRRAEDQPPAPTLHLDGTFGLLAELKLRSPAMGKFGGDAEGITGRVTAYGKAGAAAVSVLTEPDHFDGSLEHLTTAAVALEPFGVPVMRKDFLVDPYQLYEARAAGAGGVLLIVRMLPPDMLGEMLAVARELRLFVLLEAFDDDDLAVTAAVIDGPRPGSGGGVPSLRENPKLRSETPAATSGAARQLLVGVNCRDLRTLEVRRERFLELAPLLPAGMPRVAESGITTPEDCAAVARAGYQLALVGGALMQAPEPGALLAAMLAAGRAAS